MKRLLCCLLLLLTAGSVSAAAAEPRAVFGTDLTARLAAYKTGHAKMIAKGDGQPFDHAFRSSVDAAKAHPWDVQMITQSTEAVSAGETVALVFAIRDANGGGHMGVKLMDKGGATLFRQELKPDGTWRKAIMSAKATADCAAGDLKLILFFGQQKQECMVAEASVLAFPAGTKPAFPAALEALPEMGGAKAAPAPTSAAAGTTAAPAEAAAPAPAAPFVMPTLPPLDTTTPRYVVLKIDDLKAPINPRFKRIADYIDGKSLKCSFGIIANSLEADNPAAFDWIRKHAVENGGRFEFWFHGYDHAMNMEVEGKPCKAEFSGPPYAYQLEHFAKGCKLMKERVGFPFRTFGAAGNAVDATGVRVLEENPEIRVWLFGPPNAKTSKVVIPRAPELEYAVGKVSLEAFVKAYVPKRTQVCVALQGHGAQWDDAMFADFQRIVELLQADGRTFVTPCEYADIVTAAAKK